MAFIFTFLRLTSSAFAACDGALFAGPDCGCAQKPQLVGTLQELNGIVMAVGVDGKERVLKINDPVYKNEIIRTDVNSGAHIRFVHNRDKMEIGVNAEVKINDFVLREEDNSFGVLPAVQNIMRFLGPKQKKPVKTPANSTMTVRG